MLAIDLSFTHGRRGSSPNTMLFTHHQATLPAGSAPTPSGRGAGSRLRDLIHLRNYSSPSRDYRPGATTSSTTTTATTTTAATATPTITPTGQTRTTSPGPQPSNTSTTNHDNPARSSSHSSSTNHNTTTRTNTNTTNTTTTVPSSSPSTERVTHAATLATLESRTRLSPTTDPAPEPAPSLARLSSPRPTTLVNDSPSAHPAAESLDGNTNSHRVQESSVETPGPPHASQENSVITDSPPVPLPAAADNGPESEPGTMARSRSATTGDLPPDMLPSIRLSAFYDARSNRPSLSFTPLSRTLPSGKEVIKVGRYSERENHAQVPSNTPSAHPVGFKSKVVSRRHCEFWYEQGKWYIKDVKSSSGTFLNHIRLSAPGTESKPFPINDGDIVQLGIDFKGGEEMIYRCVKMRIELNRGWQAKPNTFNMATHQRLRNMNAGTSQTAQDCSICLSAIAPCQSLFVAPCSHTWHYKCIREMLTGPSWPIFICPNCRAAADLDAEVEEPAEEWQNFEPNAEENQPDQPAETKSNISAQAGEDPSASIATNGETSQSSAAADADSNGDADGDADMTMQIDRENSEGPTGAAQSSPVPIPGAREQDARRTPSPNDDTLARVVTEGPTTPRNDAGPWVFDGDPARVSTDVPRRPGAMTSLDGAAQDERSRT